jgi:ABC-type transport system involved in multi-copper enzyme maturation permease subunit
MLGKLFLKEWREKILIVLMAIFLLAALIFLRFSGKQQLTMYFFGMFVWFFFPFAALLIGSSGFYSELKDNAWIYLFSRPVKKWTIWLTKYFAQLSILLSIFLIFRLTILLLPELEMLIDTYSFPTMKGDFSLFSFVLSISISAFTLAFSMSFLHEKQFIIFLSTILIGVGLGLFFDRYLDLLRVYYPYASSLKGISYLWPLSFVSASILTFIKSDLSQTKKIIWFFTKSVLLFLVGALLISSTWTIRGSRIRNYVSDLQILEGDAFFSTRKGIFKYHSEKDKVEKIAGSRSRYTAFSLGKGKMAYRKYIRRSEGAEKISYYELRIMNTDRPRKNLRIAATQKIDSPFYNHSLRDFMISPDGEKVIFVTELLGKSVETLWWVLSDGTGLKSRLLDFPGIKNIRLVDWIEEDNILILRTDPNRKLLKYDLESGIHQVLADYIQRPYSIKISPKQDFYAFSFFNREESEGTLVLLDLKTLKRKEIYKGDLIRNFKWSKNGDKITFLIEKNKLGVYSFLDNKTREIHLYDPIDQAASFEHRVDWTFDDKKFVYIDKIRDVFYIRVFGRNLKEEKRIEIPDPGGFLTLWGLDDIALLRKFHRRELWRVDLETEHWRRIYR